MSARRPRRTSAENRRLLLEASRAILRDRGLASPVRTITLREAHERAGVPQQSAYRLYQGRERAPQEEFQRDVLAHLLTGDPLEDMANVGDGVVEYLVAQSDVLNGGTPHERGIVFREQMRLATGAWVEAARDSHGYAVAVVAAVAESHDAPAIMGSFDSPLRHHFAQLEQVLGLFGLAYRSGFTTDIMIQLSSAMFAGGYVSDVMTGAPFVVHRDTGPRGEPQPWTVTGILCEALCARALVHDGDSPIETSLEPLLSARILP